MVRAHKTRRVLLKTPLHIPQRTYGYESQHGVEPRNAFLLGHVSGLDGEVALSQCAVGTWVFVCGTEAARNGGPTPPAPLCAPLCVPGKPGPEGRTAICAWNGCACTCVKEGGAGDE